MAKKSFSFSFFTGLHFWPDVSKKQNYEKIRSTRVNECRSSGFGKKCNALSFLAVTFICIHIFTSGQKEMIT